MNIEFLKTYYEVKNTLGSYETVLTNPEGMSIAEIQEEANKLNNGIPLPKAMQEYLFIGGEYNAIGLNAGRKIYKKMRDVFNERFAERGMSIDRPFMLFDNLDGEAFSFIYLDEGDDPQPYNVSVHSEYDSDDGEAIWPEPFKTFSELIETLVNRAKKGLPPA